MRAHRVVLRGGQVVDGTGAPAVRADVAIRAGMIEAVGTVPGDSDSTVVDVSGATVAPGFIDVHTHSDALGWADPDDPRSQVLATAALRQGVTTEICGNCGTSLFPTSPEHAPLAEQFAAATFGSRHTSPDFSRFAGTHPPGRYTNLASLVGHGTLRTAVLGFDDRAAGPEELDRMCALLDACLTQGAAGLSSGLIYPPGSYAGTAEMVALAAVTARHGKPYVTHLRDEMAHVEEALLEALHIAERSGAPLQVSHHKTAGRYAWGQTVNTLARLDEARDAGVDVTCDVYPYDAASTHLHAMLPPWASEGGIDAMLARVSEPGVRARIALDIADGVDGWENTVGNGGWDLISVSGAEYHPEWLGRRIADIADEAHVAPVDLVCDLLVAEHGAVTIISHSMQEADVRRVLASPLSMIGSDGVPRGGRPHPRWAGSFARVLGHYCRQLGLFPLERAVYKMTGMAAARFGLVDRGLVTPGARADLVVFDPAAVRANATFDEPFARPDGIAHVLVAGEFAVRDSAVTDVRAGRVLAVGASAR